MVEQIREEYERTRQKRDEIKESLKKLEEDSPGDSYTITVTRDRLAYWEGKTEGLKFALDHLKKRS